MKVRGTMAAPKGGGWIETRHNKTGQSHPINIVEGEVALVLQYGLPGNARAVRIYRGPGEHLVGPGQVFSLYLCKGSVVIDHVPSMVCSPQFDIRVTDLTWEELCAWHQRTQES